MRRKLPRNGSSDVPDARLDLYRAKQFGTMDRIALRFVNRALSKMTRKRKIRCSPRKQKIRIMQSVRAIIFRLARTDMSMSDIARAAGLGSQAQGRVSEVLNGKR